MSLARERSDPAAMQRMIECWHDSWQRLRPAARAYDSYGGDWADAMLRDLLFYLDQQQRSVEITLAVAAARSGTHIGTGTLRQEQALFENSVRHLQGDYIPPP